MKYKVIEWRMNIPGLNQLHHSIVEALAGLYRKLIQNCLPVLPLSVRLIQAQAPVGRKICIVLILMKALFLESVENADKDRDEQYDISRIFFHALQSPYQCV